MKKRSLSAIILVLLIMFTSSVSTFAATTSTTTTPAAPTLSYTPTAPTNGNVTVTIYYPSTAAVKEYKLGTNGTWIKYTSPITVTSNIYICAQYQTKSGVWSLQGGVTISNIDKTAPALPTFTPSLTQLTNQNVAVTINYSSDSTVKQYKIGSNGTWINYSAPVLLTSNNTIYAKASDNVGNWTAASSYAVTNIDKTPPSSPVLSEDITAPTNGSVNVTISYPADASLKQYKVGASGVWNNYANPIQITSNSVVYARAQDAAGNWSSESSLAISNIDKTAPDAPSITASNSNPTNQDVTITISYSNDSALKKYMLGSQGIWNDYSSPLVISANDTVYAKAADSAGNWTTDISLAITNIDKTPPSQPIIAPSTTALTNQDVSIDIGYSTDSVIRQYRIGSSGVWADYSIPVIMTYNDTIYARSSDIAGNWSLESVYSVGNIDKIAPSSPVLTPSITGPTNQNVSVLITYSDDSSIRQYKTGLTGQWLDYTGPVVLSSNDIVYAKASDLAGNWTGETSIQVSNIDKTAPDSPSFSPSNTAATSLPVTLTINYSSDSATKLYKIGVSGSWTNYSGPLTIAVNSVIYAKASDLAGNWTPESYYTVSNIFQSKMVLGYTVKTSSTDKSSYNSMAANLNSLDEIETATFYVDGTGTLAGSAPIEQISLANSNGITAKLMVSNNFDATIAKQLLESPTNRQKLKDNILNLIITYGYKGVDIDLENIPAADRDYLTTLMSELYSTLKPLGYEVSIAVPAKTYDSSTATWNYGFDYKSLAQYSDYLMIMAYDEHYPGGTPGVVASINWVTSVVNYALTVVPKDKIVLGLAAYGYDWSNGTTKAYSINGCLNLAATYGATIYFDSTTKSKYFSYTVSGVSHTVWFEDADTIAYKLDLVNSKDIKGIGIWRLGLENSNYWSVINSKLGK